NVDDTAYRSFSRQRKLSAKPVAEPIAIDIAPEVIRVPEAPDAPMISPATILPPAVQEIDPASIFGEQLRRMATSTTLSPNPETRCPGLAVYSLAGGVGRTTISANLGRVLCSMGERPLLVDASGSGLLPFYFGS